MPPTQCTPKASSESSYPNFGFITVTAIKQKTLTINPIIIAEMAFTYPAAGVIATNPATAPEHKPNTVGLPLCHHSINAQLKPAAAAAVLVTTNAFTARPLAAKALPALKPNHPNHNSPVPNTTKGILWGVGTFLSKLVLLPKITAVTSAAMPALICTTVPPAKSNAPRLRKNPPIPQTQWQSGA